MPVKVSVVILTRNEAPTIRACIESVLAAVDRARNAGTVDDAEVMLVDSASEDRTVEIARTFPIRILRLPRDAFLSAGAGSYVGCRHATGDVIAIVNGDMTIEPSYLERAIPYLRDDVGAVLGIALEQLGGGSLAERLLLAAPLELSAGFVPPPELASNADGTSAGTLLLRRAALARAGPYDPFLVAAEDYDMRVRLEASGYRVLNIPVVEGRHFWAESGRPLGLRDLLRTLHRNSIGLGQLLRLRGFSSRSWPILRRAVSVSAVVAAVRSALLGLSVASLVAGVGLWDVRLAAMGVFIAALASLAVSVAPGRGEERLLLAFFPALQAAVRVLGMMRGLASRPREPEDYPTDVEEIRPSV